MGYKYIYFFAYFFAEQGTDNVSHNRQCEPQPTPKNQRLTPNNQATVTIGRDSRQLTGSTLQLNSTTINNNKTTLLPKYQQIHARNNINTRQIKHLGGKQKCAKFIIFDGILRKSFRYYRFCKNVLCLYTVSLYTLSTLIS